jgi:hypothetical protein
MGLRECNDWVKMKVTVDQYVSELRQTVIVASLNFDVWWVFKSRDTRPLYADAMNRYLQFFTTSIHAHFVALLMALYRLYETRRDTFNIPSLLKIIRDPNVFPASVFEEVDKIYARARPLWVKVSVLRNEAFGHRILDLSVEDVFGKANVTRDELKELIDLTKQLMNTLSLAHDDSTHAFNLDATRDTLRMLDDLKGLSRKP